MNILKYVGIAILFPFLLVGTICAGVALLALVGILTLGDLGVKD